VPWKKPLYFGLGDIWSFINLTFKVSIGVTAPTASARPAPETKPGFNDTNLKLHIKRQEFISYT